jgi:hypothetical protein
VASSSEEAVAPTGTPAIDTSRIPRGERAARALVDAVATGDDRLERHYLELKGPLDLKNSKDKAKLAKFILGAANRMPDTAAVAFGGHAVMVIGVADGLLVGMPPVEHLDIEKAITPFIGTDGPQWDLIRVPVPDSANDILILIVDPPQWGQPPFSCRKDGDGGLVDGDIYVRGDGETRRAKSGDHAALARRTATASIPSIAFNVSMDGEAVPLIIDDATLEAYIAAERQRLLGALPRTKPRPRPTRLSPEALERLLKSGAAEGPRQASMDLDALSGIQGSLYDAVVDPAEKWGSLADTVGIASLFLTPEPRTQEQYLAEIDSWERRVRTIWPGAVDELVRRRLPSVAPRVENLEEAFLHDVELEIHLEGDVRGVEAEFDEYKPTRSVLGLPHPPRTWGPKPFDTGRFHVPQYHLMGGPRPSAAPGPSMTWDNTGSVTLKFDVGVLRPRGTYVCPDSNLILVVDEPSHPPVRGTWRITARDHNKIYSGELVVPVGEPLDPTAELRSILLLDADD